MKRISHQYNESMEERKLDGIWNAARLLKELLCYADESGIIRDMETSDDSPYGIKVRRFVAAMKAYGKEDALNNGIEHIISASCSEDKMNELWQLLRSNLGDRYFAVFAYADFLDRACERKHLFEALFRYRKSLYRVENLWAGMIECSRTIALAYRLTSNLNQTQIKAVSDVIDRMLVLLMGDDYDKTFSEDELLPFGYPYVTDKELEDMIFDNW